MHIAPKQTNETSTLPLPEDVFGKSCVDNYPFKYLIFAVFGKSCVDNYPFKYLIFAVFGKSCVDKLSF